MAKKTRVISVRGMPSDMKAAMDSRISNAKITSSAAYSAAIEALCTAIENGEHVQFPTKSSRIGKYTVKLPRSVVERADAVEKQHNPRIKKSDLLREAVRMYVSGPNSP